MLDRNQNKSVYDKLIEEVFFNHYQEDLKEFEFKRDELRAAAEKLGLPVPSNLGDVLYTYRFGRRLLPKSIRETAGDLHWVIPGAGRGRYKFALQKYNQIVPNNLLTIIKVPDATPSVVEMYALSDEQALLAKVRYNRLIDIFTGIVCYSLQNHLRTTIRDVGQVETDELYVGVDLHGAHYILPVQAKGGTDVLGPTQVQQDIALCAEKFPNLICRAIAAQFINSDVIVLFELKVEDGDIRLIQERHYQLVAPDGLSEEEIASYRSQAQRGA